MVETAKKHLLLVEDEAIIALSEAQTIRDFGFEVDVAYSGEMAVEIAASDSSIALVLMDIDLGKGIDGTEAAEQILRARDVPVVFLSSHTEKTVVERTERITNYGYIVKSAGSTVLEASIKMALRLHDANRATAQQLEVRKRYEAALVEANSLSHQIMDSLNEGLVVYDRELRHIVWNPFMERLVGVRAADVLGKYPLEVFPFLREVGVISCLEQALSGESPSPIEFLAETAQGDRWVVSTSTPLRNADDEVIGVIETVQDVTRTRQSRERLKESELKYRQLVENAPVGIFRTTSEGTILDANATFAKHHGLSTGEEAARYYTDVSRQLYVNPQRRQEFLAELSQYGRVENFECEVNRVDGKTVWVSMEAHIAERMADGKFVIEGFSREITERKRAQELLQKSEELYRTMFTNHASIMLLIDPDTGGIVDANGAAEAFYGYPADALRTMRIHDLNVLAHDEVNARMDEVTELRGGQFTYTHRLKSGEERTIETRSSLITLEKRKLLFSVIDDVTEKRKLEREKQALLEDYETVFNGTQDAMFLIDVTESGGFIYRRSNRAHEKSTGILTTDFPGKTAEDMLGPTQAAFVIAKDQECVDSRAPVAYRAVVDLPTGKKSLSTILTPVIRDGRVVQLVASAREITEQLRAEERIREYDTMIELAISTAGILWWEMDVPTRKAVLHGHRIGPLLDSELSFSEPGQFLKLVHPEDYQAVYDSLQELMAGRSEQLKVKCRTRGQTEEYRWMQVAGTIVQKDENGAPVRAVGILQDVNEREQRAETIGALVEEKELVLKEIHHRVRNTFSSVYSLLSLRAHALEDPKAKAVIEETKLRFRGMSMLYDKLFLTDDLQNISLSAYLRDLVDEVVASFPCEADVKVRKRIDDCQVPAKETTNIGIVVNELLTNALKHAFEGRTEGEISVEVSRDAASISVSVADDGVGVPEDFVVEESSGFGMLLINALTRQMGGTVRVERGNGARFVLELPV